MLKQWMIALALVAVAGGGIFAWQALVPETAEENQRQRPPSKVNVVTPVIETVRDAVSAVGNLKARDDIALTAEVAGRVVEKNLNPGQKVQQGDLLLRLDDRQALADLKVAEATLADARRQWQRARSLQANNSISQSQVDALRTALNVADAQQAAAQTRVDNHRIVAPFSGVVGLNDISIGTYLSEGDTVATLDATDVMELSFAVPEKFVGTVRVGQQVEGQSPAFPDQSFSGKLVELGTRINELSRTLPVRALIENPDGKLRPGQFMSASLTLQEREALVIPEQAVLIRGDETYVFVAHDGSAKRLSVQLGSRAPGIVEVSSGLTLEDRVIVTGQDRLSSGDRIQVVEDTAAIPDNRFSDIRES